MSTDLLQSKRTAQDAILDLIERGTAARDAIDEDYRVKRGDRTFDPAKDLAAWNEKFDVWYEECWSWISEAFDRPTLVLNRFKDPQMDFGVPAGHNVSWAVLRNNFNARLRMLDDLFTAVASVEDETWSDFVELKPGIAGMSIRLDKIIGRLWEKARRS